MSRYVVSWHVRQKTLQSRLCMRPGMVFEVDEWESSANSRVKLLEGVIAITEWGGAFQLSLREDEKK